MSINMNVTNIGGKVIYDIEGKTLSAVEAKIEGVLRRYHPMGYGTSFSEPCEDSSGMWHAKGSRDQSCN